MNRNGSESETDDSGWIPAWLWWSGICLVILFLLLFTTYYGLTWKWKSDFQEQVRKLKQDGRPHSPEALQEAYQKRSPERMDYSDWKLPEPLKKALGEIESSGELSRPHGEWLNEPPEKRKEKADRILSILNEHEDVLTNQLEEEIHPAKYNFSRGLSVVTDKSKHMSEARLFSFYAKALIDAGKPVRALPVIRTLYRRGRVLRQEPFQVSFLTGAVFTVNANSVLELLLLSQEIPVETLDVFQTESAETMKDDLVFALEGILVVTIRTLQTAIQKDKSEASSLPEWVPADLLWLPLANYVRDYRNSIKYIEKPYYNVRSELKRIQNRDFSTASYYERYANLFWYLAAPPFKSAYEQMNDLKAKRELLRLAVRARLRSQREETGLTPIPEIGKSTDPYSGEPYRVNETDSQVTLYSVGRNLTDDGGAIGGKDDNDPKDVGVRMKK